MNSRSNANGGGTPLSHQLRWITFQAAERGREAAGRDAPDDQPTAGAPRICRRPLRAQRAVLLAWMLLSDAAALAVAFALAYWIRFGLQITVSPEVAPSASQYAFLSALLVGLWMLVFVPFDLYALHPRSGGPVETARAFKACTMAAMVVVAVAFLAPTFIVSRVWLGSAWLLSFLCVAVARFINRRVIRAARRRGYLLAQAVIAGTNGEAASLAGFLGDWQASGVWVSGFVSAGGPDETGKTKLPVLGRIEDIETIVTRQGIEEIIVAITSLAREDLLRLCEDVDALPVRLRLSPGLYELLTTRVSVQTVDTVPLMSLQKNRLTRREAATKAALDIALALVTLLFVWPLMLAIAVAIKLDSPGPVIHRRRVLGVGGHEFDAFKFRTMVVNGDEVLRSRPGLAAELAEHHKLKDDPRITRVGRWLRGLSFDELPQLFNVLAGQMSLVGPRMITPGEGAKYGRHRMNLLTVKPGITGLWQVSGRSDLTYEERVRIDMFYVRHYSMWLDLQILFVQTPPAVLRRRGAY